MTRDGSQRAPTNRRSLLKGVGLGVAGFTTVAVTQPASAKQMDRSADRARNLSLDIAIGNKKMFGGWEEFDDYHDLENKTLSGFDVQMMIWGGDGSTLLCQTAILQGSSLEAQEGSGVEYADDPHEDFHGHMSGSLDGTYTLFGTVTDVQSGEATTATTDFTVR